MKAVESTTGELPFPLSYFTEIALTSWNALLHLDPATQARCNLNCHTPSDFFSRFTMFSQLTKQQTTGLWMWRMEYEHHEQRPLYFGEWFWTNFLAFCATGFGGAFPSLSLYLSACRVWKLIPTFSWLAILAVECDIVASCVGCSFTKWDEICRKQ